MTNPQAFYDLLGNTRTRLLGNIFFPDSAALFLAEIDYFLRRRSVGEIDRKGSYLAVLPKGRCGAVDAIAAVYSDLFNSHVGVQIMTNDELAELAYDIQTLHPEMMVDVGLTPYRLAFEQEGEKPQARLIHPSHFPREICWAVSRQAAASRLHHYRMLRQHKRETALFSKPAYFKSELSKLIPHVPEKLAVVSFHASVSADGVPSMPMPDDAVLPLLNELGYQTVVLGEPGSPNSQYRESLTVPGADDDFQTLLTLVGAADLLITGDAESAGIADMLETPSVVCGHWDFGRLPMQRHCVVVPALVRTDAGGSCLRFHEQAQHLIERPEYWDGGGEGLAPDTPLQFPDSEDVCAAIREAASLLDQWIPRSPLQDAFFGSLGKVTAAGIDSRPSQAFLQRYPEALRRGF